jgi:transcriptional regulator with XRE-family HTH domain
MEVREAFGLTQLEVEKKAKLPPTFISQCERGQRVPSLENYAKIVKAIGTNAATMIGLK